MRMDRYIGQIVEIIYAGSDGFSQRRVKVLGIDGDHVRAFCLERMAPRTFRADDVLAVMPSGAVRRRRAAL